MNNQEGLFELSAKTAGVSESSYKKHRNIFNLLNNHNLRSKYHLFLLVLTENNTCVLTQIRHVEEYTEPNDKQNQDGNTEKAIELDMLAGVDAVASIKLLPAAAVIFDLDKITTEAR
jgi:hypothetical protein